MQEAMAQVTGPRTMLRLSLSGAAACCPWLFLGPGLLWLIIFFAIPLGQPARRLADDRRPRDRLHVRLGFSTYSDAIADYDEQFLRSIGYAATATVLCFVIAFPLAYFIAFKAGRWKNFMLLLIILPFFMSYVLRTVVVAADPRRRRLGRRPRSRTSGCSPTTGGCSPRARP